MTDELSWPGRTVVVSGVASDAHTWNLVYLQLLLEELGYRVVNLGPCVPEDLLAAECAALKPELVVLSSVNGHGHQDGLRMVRRVRAMPGLEHLPMVIGGKLGISGAPEARIADELLEAGFDAVFQDGSRAAASFRGFLDSLSRRALR